MKIPSSPGAICAALLINFFFFFTAAAQQNTLTDKQKAMTLLRKNLPVSGLNQSALNDYTVTDAYLEKRSGDFIVYLQQGYLGIPVYNKIGVYIFHGDTLVGRTLNFIGKIASKAGKKVTYTVNPDQAVRTAAAQVGIVLTRTPKVLQVDDVKKKYVYSEAGTVPGPVTTTGQPSAGGKMGSDLVWLPVNDGSEVRLSWNVRIGSGDGRADWLVRIDAQTGEYIEKSSLVVNELMPGQYATDDGRPANNDVARADGDARPVKGGAQEIKKERVMQARPVGTLAQPAVTLAPPSVTSVGYRVFPFPLESGNYGARSIDTDPWLKAGGGNNATTLGWHFDNTTNYAYTRGNNVWAQEDLAGTSTTNGISDTSSTAIPSLTFDRTLDISTSPEGYSNMRAGIDNLFYWTNLMHDISYQYGFDEAAGNFQMDNQGRGGQGGDYVNAWALDGTGLDNANFATPPDGENPRMRMFQFTSGVTYNLHINAPSGIIGDYAAAGNSIDFGSQLADKSPLTGDVVLVDDGTGTNLACNALINPSTVAGKIALVMRGSCPGGFPTKIRNAQNAGAIAVIVINNVAGAPVTMGGVANDLTIPAIMVSNTTGDLLKANLTGLKGTLSTTGVFRDGSLDNGVVSHEYTHGISSRLTGGPGSADCLSNAEQMGEGWSDFVALMVTTDWSTAAVTDGPKKRPLGTYVANQTATDKGIRNYPYSTDMSINPWTYAMLATNTSSGEAHSVGEIWCAALWDMTWNIIQMEGIDADLYHGTKGNNIALQLVIQGLKYQPCGPGFLDGRDAILKADSILYGYKHKCAIWTAFAGRGMGKSAKQGSASSYTDQVAAFDKPSGLGLSQSVNKTVVSPGDNVTYTLKAYCDCTPLSGITVVDTLVGGMSFVSAAGGTYTAPYVHFDNLSFTAGETKTLTIAAQVTGAYRQPVKLIDDGRDPASYTWTATPLTGSTNFAESTTRHHTGTHAWLAVDQAVNSDYTLTSGDLLLDTVSTLSFWHYYETDPYWDGGVVEISTDGGGTWQDMGPYMVQNVYNSNLSSSTPGLGNRKAFSGSSGGKFIQTVARITGLAGTHAKIRFRFASDNVDGGEGWYIDDVLMQNESGALTAANAFSGSTLLSGQSVFVPFASVPLPVHFIDFQVKKAGDDVRVQWKVNGEINVSKYVVERSANGSSFNAIGELPADAGLTGTKDYTFPDAQPLNGLNYYRVVGIDLDGKLTYSEIRSVDMGINGMVIRLAPVPTYDHQVQVELATGDNEAVQAVLLNALGKALKIYGLKQGVNRLDLGGFAAGIYFLKIQTGQHGSQIRKLVIQ